MEMGRIGKGEVVEKEEDGERAVQKRKNGLKEI
jgi:hypothetical protein